LLIHAKVRSTTQRRGGTSKARGSRLETICKVIFIAAAQMASLPV
jgi:hypothetical protein